MLANEMRLPLSLRVLWAAGLLVRLAFVFLEPATRPVADETMWLMATQRIPAAGFSPFANYPIFHPPLYPFFLAALHEIGGLLAIKVTQAIAGSCLIPAVYRIGARLFGVSAGLGAAAIMAFYPELIWYSAHFWCETLFLVLVWWGVERALEAGSKASLNVAAVSGVLLGLAALTRETILYVVPVVALWLLVRTRSRAVAATLLGVAFAVVVPWTLRNQIQFGAFIPVSTGGGLNLYQGNADVPRTKVYEEYYANDGKVEQYLWARAEGLKAIARRQPWWIFEKIRDEGPRLAELDSLALIHIRRGAYGDTSCVAYRMTAAAILVPWGVIAFLAVIALARLKLDLDKALPLLVTLSYLALHLATHGFSRYRLPVVPAVALVAVAVLEPATPAELKGRRMAFLIVLLAALTSLLAPSALDQAGFLGLITPPDFEGFAPVCEVA